MQCFSYALALIAGKPVIAYSVAGGPIKVLKPKVRSLK